MTQPSLALPECSVDRPPAEDVMRWSAGALLGVLWLIAGVLAWRRLAATTIDPPLPVASLAALALLAATFAAGVRLLWRPAPRAADRSRCDRLVPWLPLPAVATVAAALGAPGSSPAGIAVLATILVAEEALFLAPTLRHRRRWRRRAPQVRFDAPQRPSTHLPVPFGAADSAPADEVTQQLTRSQSDDGAERLTGWIRVALGPGQRTASAHIAFCPPFEHVPTLEAVQSTGPAARIRTIQLLPFGARLDLKLAKPSHEPTSVLLQFTAESTPERPDTP